MVTQPDPSDQPPAKHKPYQPSAEKTITAYCPRCERHHKIKIYWTGHGIPHLYCRSCKRYGERNATILRLLGVPGMGHSQPRRGTGAEVVFIEYSQSIRLTQKKMAAAEANRKTTDTTGAAGRRIRTYTRGKRKRRGDK